MKTRDKLQHKLITIVEQLITESGENQIYRNISIDSSLQQHLGIDSIGRAELFSRIEREFNIQFSQQQLTDANSLKDIYDAILTSSTHVFEIPDMVAPLESITQIDPHSAKTLIDVLLLYAIQTPERTHIYFQNEFGKEEIITYGKLLESAQRVAHALQENGMRAGDTIAIMLPTSPEFFYTFFGVLIAGCLPVPIYPPFRPHQIEAYAKQEAKILQNAETRMLITFQQAEKLSKLLRAFIPSLKVVTTAATLLKSTEKAPIYPNKSDDFALIQYTSGSTSTPKGVLLSHFNLLSNIRCFGKAIQVDANDIAVSWAPLYHDLGLIGMWLGSLYHGVPLTIMSPLTFLTRPERWLWAMHYHRGTISGGPNFAYELCIRKIQPEQIEGLDLSAWRLALNGAEAIQPSTLKRFTEKFAPYGFRHETHFPVYGLAESTVCVATSPLNRGPRIDKVQRNPLEKEKRAVPATDSSEKNTLEFVACGKPIPEHNMRVVNEEGNALPERHVGHLQFQGPSSMQGYYGNPEATQAIFQNEWWGTGDLAYIADGEIFITGRRKDMIIKAGRNLYPAEIEQLTSQVPNIRKGCVIAFGIQDSERGTEKLVIVAETDASDTKQKENIISQINELIINALDIAPDHIVLTPPQVIPKTSSGKLQRSACKTMYLSNKLSRGTTSVWRQLFNLSMQFCQAKIGKALKTFLKIFYSIYVLLLLLTTIPFVWLSLWITPRRVAARICHYWARFITRMVFCPLKYENKKNLTKYNPIIYTLNHTSYVDAIIALAIAPPNTRLVGKSDLINMPIVRSFIKKLGFLAVERFQAAKGLEHTKEMKEVIKSGHSILLFPEGTFTYSIGLRSFRKGAFKVAAETNTPICPIALQGARSILRGEGWLVTPHSIRVTVCEPIFPHGADWQQITALKDQVREKIAEHCGEGML